MSWTWDDLDALPQPVFDELVAYLADEQRRQRRR